MELYYEREKNKFKFSLDSVFLFYISHFHALCVFDRTVVQMSVPLESEVNLKLQNIMMLLRKCCNHPYLIEYPIDPVTQEFKVSTI